MPALSGSEDRNGGSRSAADADAAFRHPARRALGALALVGLLACGEDPRLARPGPGGAGRGRPAAGQDQEPAAQPGGQAQGQAQGAPGADAEAGEEEPLELDITDLRQTAAEWPEKLEKMRRDLAEVESFHASGQVEPLLKLEAWQRYLEVYAQDVPYSHEDDLLRQAARGHIEDLRLRTRFVDFDDGTVVDTLGARMWTRRGVDVSLRYADEYCRNLTFGLGRYGDWRLPEVEELADLYDSSSTDEVKILGGFEISSYRGGVWSAKSQAGCRQGSLERGNLCPAFVFEDGRQEPYEYAGEVLCVRDQPWPMVEAAAARKQ